MHGHHDRYRTCYPAAARGCTLEIRAESPSFQFWSKPIVSTSGPDRVILAVAVPSPLKRVFDYLPGHEAPEELSLIHI